MAENKIKEIVISIYDAIKINLDFIPKLTKTGDFLTINLGLVASILTLVGLLSIFISINSQHKIEKTREILWKIKTEDSNVSEVVKELNLYHQLQSDSEIFTSKIINIVLGTIGLASIIIFTSVVSLINSVQMYTFIFSFLSSVSIIGVMITFFFVLNRLKSIPKVSGMPNIEDLLDADNLNADFYSLVLAGKTMRIQSMPSNFFPLGDNNHIELFVLFPLPFNNIYLFGSITGISSEGKEDVLELPKVNINPEQSAGLAITGTATSKNYYGFSLGTFKREIISKYRKLSISLYLNGKQGQISLRFDNIPIEEILCKNNPKKIEGIITNDNLNEIYGTNLLSPYNYYAYKRKREFNKEDWRSYIQVLSYLKRKTKSNNREKRFL
jgi:hypothetical protein